MKKIRAIIVVYSPEDIRVPQRDLMRKAPRGVLLVSIVDPKRTKIESEVYFNYKPNNK